MKTSRAVASAAALLLISALPAFAQQSPASPAQVPPAQAQMSDAMVNKVGTALRHVAMIRQQYSQQAQSANSAQQKQTLNDQAKGEMVKAISDQGLSVQQYQQVIRMAQSDESLKQRLMSAAEKGD